MNSHLQAYAEAYTSRKGGYAVLLFFIWPFLATVVAFRNYREPWAMNLFWAFCAFYGFTFAIGAETEGMDIMAYINGFQEMYGRSMSFNEVVAYFRQSGEIDILRTSISYLLSRITGHQAALTMVYGAIFGYFFSRNIWFVLRRLKGKLAPLTLLLVACYFLVNPIWQINGFRMWTAAHVFLFGMLPWLFDGNKRYIWVSVLSILVHFSFIVPVGVAIGYFFLGNRMNVYFAIYVMTFFVTELNISALNNIMESYAPEILQERTIHYRTEGAVERRAMQEDNRNWYVKWDGKALSWAIMGFIILLFWRGRDFFKENRGYLSLFSFTLLYYSAANILSMLPSGGRFTVIAQLLALALITLYVQNRSHDNLMRRFTWLTLPGLLLYVVVAVRTGLYSISASSIIGNPITALFVAGENISLNDVMRMIL